MEAISHAGTCLGILATDGILVAAEKRNVHKLLDDEVGTFFQLLLISAFIRFSFHTEIFFQCEYIFY